MVIFLRRLNWNKIRDIQLELEEHTYAKHLRKKGEPAAAICGESWAWIVDFLLDLFRLGALESIHEQNNGNRNLVMEQWKVCFIRPLVSAIMGFAAMLSSMMTHKKKLGQLSPCYFSIRLHLYWQHTHSGRVLDSLEMSSTQCFDVNLSPLTSNPRKFTDCEQL